MKQEVVKQERFEEPRDKRKLIVKMEDEEEMESQEQAEAAVASNVWTSPMIHPTIRRPWRIFEEDLEDQLKDLEDQLARVQARLEAVQGRGARAIFASPSEELQRAY